MSHRIVIGDCRESLKREPDQSVQCVVTSPPYWGLRDYKLEPSVWGGEVECVQHKWGEEQEPKRRRHDSDIANSPKQQTQAASVSKEGGGNFCQSCGAWRGCLGLEPTPDLYVAHLVSIFREVKRVLRDDGTVWLNLGSSYMTTPRGNKPGDVSTSSLTNPDRQDAVVCGNSSSRPRPGLRDPACGSGGKALPSSMASDSACSDLCDECLADFLCHRGHSVDNNRPLGQFEPLPSQTARGSEPSGSASASLDVSLHDEPASTTSESSRPRQGECSHCATCGACHDVLGSVASESLACVRTGWCLRRRDSDGRLMGRRIERTVSSGMAWSDYTTRLKHKDLVPIPWMVAMALQMDGWYLRGDQIWAKGYSFHPTTAGSCMPESVTDRPTRGHEYLFLLSKGPKYYYDHEAVKEVASCPPHAPGNKTMRRIGARAATDPAREPTRIWGAGQYAQPYAGQATKPFEESGVQNASDVKRRIVDGVRKGRITGRNLRSVWLINPKPFKKAHFATFPSMLVEPCIKAGSRPGDLVLDPFAGSGTVALVADQLGRSSLSLEAQETYVAIAVDRLEKANIVPAVEFADG